MKIITLEVENVKRIKAIELAPVGDVVVISGKNGQGKTSVLDSIEWLFAGAAHIQVMPIRKGEEFARMRATIGDDGVVEFIVTRNVRKGKPHELIVTKADKSTPAGGAQSVLDALIGPLSFDPLGFWRMTEKDKFNEVLRVFPLGVDLEQIAGLNRTDYAKRTDVNRDAKAARVKAIGITVAPNLPAETIDESALLDRITEAADGNAQIEQRKAKRAEAERRLIGERQAAANLRAAATAKRNEAAQLERESVERDADADALKAKIDDAPALPEPTDISALRSELDAAKATNEAISARQARERLEGEALSLETESKRLTEAMEAREQAKREAIAAAKLPVEGLGFGEGILTFNDVPLEQASASDGLKVCVAIAMGANPKLKVVLIRDASLLDADSRAQVKEMVTAKGCQAWLEVARTDEPSGFIIEDGTASIATPETAAAARAEQERADAEAYRVNFAQDDGEEAVGHPETDHSENDE